MKKKEELVIKRIKSSAREKWKSKKEFLITIEQAMDIGLFTQSELADLVGVSQPAISKRLASGGNNELNIKFESMEFIGVEIKSVEIKR